MDWARHWLEKGLNPLEEFLKESSGKFCFKDQISLADLFLIPQVYNAKRFGLEIKKWPKINKINKNCLELEAFKRALPENQKDAP